MPDSLDTAYTLALLQEEATKSSRKRDFRQWNQKGGHSVPDKPVLNQKPLDKKLADLKAYHRAHGLCDHCGEKWSREHKCAAQVGLHVLDKLYALFTSEHIVAGTASDEETKPEAKATCCCLSADGIEVSGVKTLQFQGQFQQQPILILLDPGSSSSFINQKLVLALPILLVSCQTVAVRVANGEFMQCSSYLLEAIWNIHQYQFVHVLKILPISHYDIILGMNWLQLFSPMKVDW